MVFEIIDENNGHFKRFFFRHGSILITVAKVDLVERIFIIFYYFDISTLSTCERQKKTNMLVLKEKKVVNLVGLVWSQCKQT